MVLTAPVDEERPSMIPTNGGTPRPGGGRVLSALEIVAPSDLHAEPSTPLLAVLPRTVSTARPQHVRPATFARPRTQIGNVFLDRLDLAGSTKRLRLLLDSGSPSQVVTVNLDFLSIARRDDAFRETINGAQMAVADGMPLVWISRLHRSRLPERVTGVDLVHASCKIAAETGRSIFLLGAAPGVAEAAGRRLQATYPGLRVSGAYSPPFGPLSPAEDARIVAMIRAAAPAFLFVALGAPRQDLWIRDHVAELDVPVLMGVGCVFDLLAGAVSRAPRWMQRVGLEWAYRLGQEPKRLWRRYVLDDMPMLFRLLFERPPAQGDLACLPVQDPSPAEFEEREHCSPEGVLAVSAVAAVTWVCLAAASAAASLAALAVHRTGSAASSGEADL